MNRTKLSSFFVRPWLVRWRAPLNHSRRIDASRRHESRGRRTHFQLIGTFADVPAAMLAVTEAGSAAPVEPQEH